jgi:hypothetical protein
VHRGGWRIFGVRRESVAVWSLHITIEPDFEALLPAANSNPASTVYTRARPIRRWEDVGIWERSILGKRPRNTSEPSSFSNGLTDSGRRVKAGAEGANFILQPGQNGLAPGNVRWNGVSSMRFAVAGRTSGGRMQPDRTAPFQRIL